MRIDGDSLLKLAELLPAVALWAQTEGEPQTSPADVVDLAIALMHKQVFDRATEMISDRLRDQFEAERERQRGVKVH